MQEPQFYNWLLKKGYTERTISSRLSNCHRVEKFEDNLDNHYMKDFGLNLIIRLTYSSADQRENRPAKHNIPIDGNVYNGTATLKQATKLYFEFKGSNSSERNTNTVTTIRRKKKSPLIRNRTGSNRKHNFTPSNKIKEFEKELCNILSQLCHHIHPRIIKQIQEVNNNEYDNFKKLFNNIIDVDNYLFHGSACVFPGVRRYVSGKGKKKQYNHDYKAIIDDNTFPRHLWCFLVNNKTYNGPNWKESGLNQFELAHIFTHKKSELNFEKQFFQACDNQIHPHGDFTCACNIVLLPKGTVRPTDNSETIKSIFYQRYIELYGETPLNGRSGFITNKAPAWYKDLKWNEPFCPTDWEDKVNNLIKYRNKRIIQLLDNIT